MLDNAEKINDGVETASTQTPEQTGISGSQDSKKLNVEEPKIYKFTKEELTNFSREVVKNKEKELSEVQSTVEALKQQLANNEKIMKRNAYLSKGYSEEQFDLVQDKIVKDENGNFNIDEIANKYKLLNNNQIQSIKSSANTSSTFGQLDKTNLSNSQNNKISNGKFVDPKEWFKMAAKNK